MEHLKDLITLKVKLNQICGRVVMVYKNEIIAYFDDAAQAEKIINHDESIFELDRSLSDSMLVDAFDYAERTAKVENSGGVYLDNVLTIHYNDGDRVKFEEARPVLNIVGSKITLTLNVNRYSVVDFYEWESGEFIFNYTGFTAKISEEDMKELKAELDKKFGMLIKYEMKLK